MNVKLTKAILNVMNEVKGIEKTLTVGSGRNSYKGIPDQEVKKIIGSSMQKNGLTIIPIDIKPSTRIDRWEQTDNYGVKTKQSVFTEVIVKYLLMHDSGESMEVTGYGHGVDSQDKGAGKATTYALKYALLYTFLVPTGKIDDSDNEHSDDIQVAKKTTVKTKIAIDKERFDKAMEKINTGEYTAEALKSTFKLTPEQLKQLK